MADTYQADPVGVARRMYESLLDSQFAPPATMQAHQQQTIRRLVGHAVHETVFWRKRLADLALGDEPIDAARWSSIEPISRRDLAENYDDLIAWNVPPNHGQICVKFTSGSSSGPLRMLRTAMTNIADTAALHRYYAEWQIDCSKPLARIRVSRNDVRRLEQTERLANSWAPLWAEGIRGPLHRLSVFTPAADQIRWLEELADGLYINTLPSNLERLVAHLRQRGQRLGNVAAVISVGETVTDELRQSCRQWLNAAIVDLYSTAECGVVATECSSGGGYHIQSEICLVEVLRPDGTACDPGEAGELVVTPFYNFAMPLIRYRTGDIATLKEQCPCGRTLPVLDTTIVRAAEQLDLGNGNRWSVPRGFGDRLTQYLGPCQWQIVQHAGGGIELRYCRPRGEEGGDEQAAAAHLASLLPKNLDVRCTEVDVIGRGPGGKFSRIIRLQR